MPRGGGRRPAVRAGRTIADVGEFGFLAGILRGLGQTGDTLVGPGQDCAVIRCGNRPYLLTIDALVEGTHFRPAWLSPTQVGRKSFLVNASDAAAMGGQPRFCVVGLCVPPTYLARDLSALQAGIVAAAGACGAAVVGGNLTRAEQLAVSIALLAEAPRRIVTRQGARPGDRVFVTGTLGDAALATRMLLAGAARCPPALLGRLREPRPRLTAGRTLAASGIASAMIDVSDGLVQDLGHICEESRVGALVEADRVPRSRAYLTQAGTSDLLALHGGEDYELLFTVPPGRLDRLARYRDRLECPVTEIGRIVAGTQVVVVDAAGQPLVLGHRGYDHFTSPRR